MEHDLNFEVSSIRFGLYSAYNFNNIQYEYLKLASLELRYLEQHYCGLRHCWKKNAPLLEDLSNFFTEFNDTFGKIDRIQTIITKLLLLRQGFHLASIYAANFCQLECDFNRDDNIFINVFWWRLQDDVKNLLLNLPDQLTLTKAITQAVQCDN